MDCNVKRHWLVCCSSRHVPSCFLDRLVDALYCMLVCRRSWCSATGLPFGVCVTCQVVHDLRASASGSKQGLFGSCKGDDAWHAKPSRLRI